MWIEEGVLHAEIELERQANVSLARRATVSSVLPLLEDGSWVCDSSCSAFEVGDFLASANPFEKTSVLLRSAVVALTGSWRRQALEETALLQSPNFGAGTGHATVVTMRPIETSSCQTRLSGRWRPQREQLNGGMRRDRQYRQCRSVACISPATSGPRKMKSRGFSTTLRFMSSCRPPDECVFGASPALRQLLRGRPTRFLGSIEANLAASSTPSQVNAFCLVLFDSFGRMSKALARKHELVLGICVKHGLAYDLMRNDLRDLILAWIQASLIRSLAIENPDGTFHVAQDQKLLQNTCRILRRAVVNITPFTLSAHESLCSGSSRAVTTCSS